MLLRCYADGFLSWDEFQEDYYERFPYNKKLTGILKSINEKQVEKNFKMSFNVTDINKPINFQKYIIWIDNGYDICNERNRKVTQCSYALVQSSCSEPSGSGKL